jgi:hypothetical protein
MEMALCVDKRLGLFARRGHRARGQLEPRDRILAVRNRSVRASDADRERVAAKLREHAVSGRLTMAELDERSGKAFSARTLDQLDAVLADLPRGGRPGPSPARTVLLLLAQGVLWVLVGVIIVTIALLWALAWAGTRLAAAAAARSLDSGRAPALRGRA